MPRLWYQAVFGKGSLAPLSSVLTENGVPRGWLEEKLLLGVFGTSLRPSWVGVRAQQDILIPVGAHGKRAWWAGRQASFIHSTSICRPSAGPCVPMGV